MQAATDKEGPYLHELNEVRTTWDGAESVRGLGTWAELYNLHCEDVSKP